MRIIGSLITGFCSPPRPPENGFISETLFGSPKTPYLDMVTFGCQEGYHIDGPTNLTCGKNGQYSSDLTVCEYSDCVINLCIHCNCHIIIATYSFFQSTFINTVLWCSVHGGVG